MRKAGNIKPFSHRGGLIGAADFVDADEATEEESGDPSPEEQAIHHSDGQRLWQFIRDHLHDEKERIVIHCSFVLDIKPQEIYELYPQLFESVDEIYRIKQNVITRLRRDPELRKLLGLDD